MVLEQSFDPEDLKRLLLDGRVVMDRSQLTSSRRNDPTCINRPPLPRGSQVFEKVLDEFWPERHGPLIRISDDRGPLPRRHSRPQQIDTNHLSPYFGRSRSNSKSEAAAPTSTASSPTRNRSPSRPGIESKRGGDDSLEVPSRVQAGQPSPGISGVP